MPSLDLRNKRVVVLLQGGGTLGAYQVGGLRALVERCRPDWVAGISIGAINAAVFARHRGPDPVAELEALWEEILSPAFPPSDCTHLLEDLRPWRPYSWLHTLEPSYAAWMWSAFNLMGQPGLYASRVLNPFTNPLVREWQSPLQRDQLAFYDTAPLRATLEKHANFDQNAGLDAHAASDRPPSDGATRLTVGACRVSDGEVVFFDSETTHIQVEHVLASGALPPAFPPIEIKNEWYIDGGVSCNTPIELLRSELIDPAGRATVVILVDLWDRKTDTLPRTMDELVWRQKSIQFGSRKKAVERAVERHQLEAELHPAARVRLDVLEVMREAFPGERQFAFSDADFLHGSYRKLRRQGYEDMTIALDRPEPVPHVGGTFATLYRYGSAHKHRSTDAHIAA